MCLAIPGKVIELRAGGKKVLVLQSKTIFPKAFFPNEKKALIEQPGVQREVFNAINAKKGEFVLVQQGFAVERISEKEAREALEVFADG